MSSSEHATSVPTVAPQPLVPETLPRGVELRQHPRYVVCRSLVAVPVLPSGALDWARRFEGMTVDVSEGGMGIEVAASGDLGGNALAIGVEGPDGRLRFEGAVVRHVQTLSPRRVRLGARFGGAGRQLLSSDRIMPSFDPQSMQYRPALEEAIARSWVDAGALRPRLLDRVQLCPKCRTLPTFRAACRSCGSARVTRDRLIHHFSCAHVGPVRDFETPTGVVCPKCRTRSLIVGSDFEYQHGVYRCLDCQWSDSELEQVGHCLRCGYRFPAHQAYEQELVGYDAERLDVLALLDAS